LKIEEEYAITEKNMEWFIKDPMPENKLLSHLASI